MTPAALTALLRAFDLPRRVDDILSELGGTWDSSAGVWRIETFYGQLEVTTYSGDIACTFTNAAKAYARLPDVRYPGGEWPHRPKARLSALGPTDAVVELSRLVARFSARLRTIVPEHANDASPATRASVGGLTTDVVAVHKGSR